MMTVGWTEPPPPPPFLFVCLLRQHWEWGDCVVDKQRPGQSRWQDYYYDCWLNWPPPPPQPLWFAEATLKVRKQFCVVDRQCPGQSGWQDYYYYYCWFNWLPPPPPPHPFGLLRQHWEWGDCFVLLTDSTLASLDDKIIIIITVGWTDFPPPHPTPLVCWGNTESEETVLCCWQTAPWPIWMTRLLLWLLVHLNPPLPPRHPFGLLRKHWEWGNSFVLLTDSTLASLDDKIIIIITVGWTDFPPPPTPPLWFAEATLRVRRQFCVVDRQHPGQSGWQDYCYDCWFIWTPPSPHATPLVCWGNTESEETVLCCWQTAPWPVWMTRLLLWLLVHLNPPPPPQPLWFAEATLRVRRLFCVVDRQRPGQSGWQDYYYDRWLNWPPPPPQPQPLWFAEATLRVRRLFCVVDRQRPGQSGWQETVLCCWQTAPWPVWMTRDCFVLLTDSALASLDDRIAGKWRKYCQLKANFYTACVSPAVVLPSLSDNIIW